MFYNVFFMKKKLFFSLNILQTIDKRESMRMELIQHWIFGCTCCSLIMLLNDIEAQQGSRGEDRVQTSSPLMPTVSYCNLSGRKKTIPAYI